MSFRYIDIEQIAAGPGPHPAASPFDKRVSEHLGLTAFEMYQVELPPGQETVLHNHSGDQVEDAYAVIDGDGWLIVDGVEVPVRAGRFIAVSIEPDRKMRAGEKGMTLIAVCGPTTA